MKKILTKTLYAIVNALYMIPLMTVLLFTNQNKEIDNLFNKFKTSMEDIY